ncbi:hypothetical protein BDR05DRAFT_967933, partial [Suillus weaverae]
SHFYTGLSSAIPRLAVVTTGAMGAAVAKRLTGFGCTVYTNLDGRSEATRKRAQDAGMIDLSVDELVLKSDCILPPRDTVSFAEKIQERITLPTAFVDCNAVNLETVKRIVALLVFAGQASSLLMPGIIGGLPKGGKNPTFYASAKNVKFLDELTALSKYGLKASPLKGEGAGVGDASALKMSGRGRRISCMLLKHVEQGITKGA